MVKLSAPQDLMAYLFGRLTEYTYTVYIIVPWLHVVYCFTHFRLSKQTIAIVNCSQVQVPRAKSGLIFIGGISVLPYS